MVTSGSLINRGPYGAPDDDPNVKLIRELGAIAQEIRIRPVVIGGIAAIVNGYSRTTVDVDLLVARADALKFVRKLEATPGFTRLRIDRFKHGATGRTVDLCVEGELTSPDRQERFPSPLDVEQLSKDPLPVVGLIDLLALKVKSGRGRDMGDFLTMYQQLRLTPKDIERIRSKFTDPATHRILDEWHSKALQEIERQKLMKPPELE